MADLPLPPTSLLDNASLFLDFDGTLVDFVVDPDAAVVDRRLRTLVRALLIRLDGRVAILSGRGLADMTERLGLDGVAMAGSHGLERRSTDGRVTRAPTAPGLAAAEAEARAFAERHEVLVEAKVAGVALHYRDARHVEAEVDRFARGIAARTGLQLQQGKCVRELRVPGADKGDAVRAFMAEPPFAAGRPIVLGDDLTDEHAFVAATELGGAGILVGPARDSAARYRLATVGSTLDWLDGGS